MVIFAVHDRLEAADGIGQFDELAGRVGELLGHEKGLAEEAADLAGARHVSLSSSDSSSMPRMAMMSFSAL